MLTEKAEGRIAMLIVDKLAFQEKLSEGEKTLAAYILAHGMEIAKYSTRSLAEVTYTSPPTVLRLCKKLGFTGFDDFKQNFVRELEYLDQQQGKVDFNFPFAENDSPMRVAQNIGELYEEAVKDTMQLLRYEDLHKRCSCSNITRKSTFFPPGRPSIRPNPSEKRCSRSASGWSFSTI